jgi:hypothetical protein
MNGYKMLAIISVSFFGFLSVMVAFGGDAMNETQETKISREHTKQLELQVKLKQLQVDSMKIAHQ